MAKNKSASKLIYYNQKQRSNKEPQRAVETTSKTPQAGKKRVRSRVTEISQRKKKIATESVVGNPVTQQGQSRPGKTNRK